ncbi:MAG: Sporulation sigma-E factor-processing peptidase [Candidatus Dichloromethanomonas elyunquensis]|nr:MAG: Sporulation sigma-E factor-processing peptidase [Candidatus Dichloromethanomonas elyunquensis]
MVYLDLILIVNGAMDAFLIFFTAHLLRKQMRWFNLLVAVLLGELPVFFVLFEFSGLAAVSRVLIPVTMVGIGLKTERLGELAKGLLFFSLLSAVCGGIFIALSGWFGLTGGDGVFISLQQLWMLPLTASLLWGGYRLWEKLQKNNLMLDNILYDAELSFDNGKSLLIKALLDTGNELRDPLTGTPVMIVEEKAVLHAIPEKIQEFLHMPWRESPNPWSYLWNDTEYGLHRLVFIAAKGINGQTWLPAIRLGKAKIKQGKNERELPVTVALVPQVLSSEGKFQALLHPDHIQKPAGKEEIA